MQYLKPTRLAIAVTSALFTLYHISSHAQDNTLGTVVVTAQKRTETLQEVPAAISALGSEELQKKNLTRTADIEKVVPNLIANQVNQGEQPRWYIRGIGFQDPGYLVVSPVGVYVDEVYLNNPYSQGFPLFDLERVEVLRGPQGTLWGKNTTGGAIHFISKKPSFDTQGYARFDYDSHSRRTLQGAYSTGLTERIAARVSLYNEQGDGWAQTRVGGSSVNASQDTALRLQFLADVSDDLQANLSLRYRNKDGDGNPMSVVVQRADGGDHLGEGSRYNFGESSALNNADIENYGVTLNLDYQLGDLNLVSITSFDDVKRYNSLNNDFDQIAPAYVSLSASTLDQHQFAQELRLSSPKDQRLSWIVGSHYFTEGLKSQSNSGRFEAPTFYRQINLDQDASSWAVFGSTTLQLTDRASLTTGLRYSRETKDLELASFQASGVTFGGAQHWWNLGNVAGVTQTAAQDQKKTWGGTTYDVTLDYRFADNVLGYVRYAKGFRSGGFNGAAATQAQVSDVSPEWVQDYEIGVKTDWFDKRLLANFSAFYYDYDDIQSNVLTIGPGGLVSTLKNAGAGWSRGVELELQAQPTEALHLYANLAYLDTRYTDFDTGTGNAKGNTFANAPRATARLGAEYSIALGASQLVPAVNYSYRGKTYFVSDDHKDPYQQQEGYGLIDASLTYIAPADQYRVSAYVNNLENRKYKLLGLPMAAGYRTYVYGDPRTLGVSLSTTF